MDFLRFVLLFVLSTQLVYATTVFPISLPDMTHGAAHIFHGRVILNEVKVDQLTKRVVTYTTFNVIERVKGKASVTHTIKQIGGQLAGSQFNYVTHDVPQFSFGAEYVIFLTKKSRLGFSSPLGLGQGSFSVIKSHGIKMVNHQKSSELLFSDQSRSAISTQTPDSHSHQTASNHLRHNNKTKLAEFIQSVRKLSENK